MRIILLGAKGMFGRDAAPLFRAAGHLVLEADLPEVDIANAGSLDRFLAENPAEVVVNAAAFTDVDGAETRREEAFRANAVGAGAVAEACAPRSLFLVHISTDYVFPGEKPEGYVPDDPTGPALSVYGQSKLEGERAVAEVLGGSRSLICRTQWLYGRSGKNFVETILSLAATRPSLRVVEDQWGVPTHTAELARQILSCLDAGIHGVAHAVGGGGPVTWHTVAREAVALSGLPCQIVPCATEEFPRPAPRPRHAWLRNVNVPGAAVRPWRESLAEYLAGG